VVNLNEICNRDFESKKFINRLSIGKNVPNNDKKELKIWDKTSIEFNKTTNKIIDDKKRKSVLSAGVFKIKSTLNKNNEDNKKNIYGNTKYLKSMKSRRKINIEDNENTPLLTRDKFKDILSKKIKANKALIIILLILIIITLFIIIGKTIQSLIAINYNLKILDVTINFEILKVDIYLEAILSLHYCLIEKKDEIKKSKFQKYKRQN